MDSPLLERSYIPQRKRLLLTMHLRQDPDDPGGRLRIARAALGLRDYFRILRAADVVDVVRSRMNLACAVARFATQSMSLDPGPVWIAVAIALSARS